MVSATFGIIVIAYKSSTVSIEIADAKINLSSAIVQVKDIKNELEIENKRLKKLIVELQTKSSANSQDSDIAEAYRSSSGIDLNEIVSTQKFVDLGTRIQQVEKALLAH
jgi:hypothetical protein